jgi:NitT/TauT family transport system substrate-binding protein
MLNVLATGNVDAVASIEPFVTIGLLEQNCRVLTMNYMEIQAETEISTYAAARDWMIDEPGKADAFRRSLTEAALFAVENESEVRSILMRYTSLDEKYVREIKLPGFSTALNAAKLDRMIRKVHGIGWIDELFDAEDLLAP